MKGRETERKYIIKDIDFLTSLKELSDIFCSHFSNELEYEQFGSDTDSYWEVLSDSPGSPPKLVRYRNSTDCKELTVKCVDQGSTENREEWNLDVIGHIEEFCNSLWGPCTKILNKSWVRLEMLDDTEICFYKVKGDGQQRIFLEIEPKNADWLARLERWEHRLKKVFTLERVDQSLFQLF